MSLLVLSQEDVDKIASQFSVSELENLMARVFYLVSNPPSPSSIYSISTPLRTVIPTQNHTALFMPAHVQHPLLSGTTLKAVCVPSKDNLTAKGLPASTIVIDPQTGRTNAILNARTLTPLRNAAGSLLSTTLVGITNPTSIVVYGAGAQISAHLRLFLRVFHPTLESITIVPGTPNSIRAQHLRDSLLSLYPTVEFSLFHRFTDLESMEKALLKASIVICATPSIEPLFPTKWVRNGTHVILVGSYTPSMREVFDTLVRRAIGNVKPGRYSDSLAQPPILLVDSRDACATEAGEFIDAKVSPDEMCEIGECLSQDENGEIIVRPICTPGHGVVDTDGPITVFKSVGVGLQDVAMACAIVDKAREMGIGVSVEGYDA